MGIRGCYEGVCRLKCMPVYPEFMFSPFLRRSSTRSVRKCKEVSRVLLQEYQVMIMYKGRIAKAVGARVDVTSELRVVYAALSKLMRVGRSGWVEVRSVQYCEG